MKDFKDAYDFKLRLANKKEIQLLIDYLVESKWKKSQLSDKSDYDNFVKKEKTQTQELIKGQVWVQEYKKYNISIFTYNYIQEYGKDKIMSLMFRVLKTERGMEDLDANDAIFDLSELQTNAYHKNQTGQGRPKRPKDQSIEKVIQIKEYIKNKPEAVLNQVLKMFGVPKSTYYRVSYWLMERGQ